MGNFTYDRLAKALEKAVHDANYWVEACDEAANILGGHSGLLIPVNPDFRGCWMKIPHATEALLEEYISKKWHLTDHRQRIRPFLEKRGYATDDDFLPSREVRNSIPFYRDFLMKYNSGFHIAIRVITSNGLWVLSVYFNNDHPPITDEQIEQSKQISKRFEEATARADELAHIRISNFAQFFNNTKTEIHLFDPLGDHCLKLDNKGGFSDDKPRKPLYLSDHLANELYDELGEICSSDPSQSLCKSHQVSFQNQKLNLLAIQVPNALRHYHMIFKVCVIVTQCVDELMSKKSNFTEQYGLTNAEGNTVELLALGNSVNAIADLLSLKPTSIRQRLKIIYEKTNVNGQVELIGLYHYN